MKLADALFQGGIRCFEITYDPSDPDTCTKVKENIQALHAQFGDELYLGIGTVLTKEQVHNAKEAGARFIVSPNFDEEIVKETLALDMVSMPGCMSPTEIVAADKAGADFIKLFSGRNTGYQILQGYLCTAASCEIHCDSRRYGRNLCAIPEAWIHRCRYQLPAGR